MNENQCRISSPKVLVGSPVPHPVQFQLASPNIICSSNICNIITLPSASVIHVVNGQEVATHPTMQNNHGQPNVNVIARPQLVHVKPVVVYQSPITVVKPVVYANKVPQQQQLCGNCGVTSKSVGQRCCGKFRPIEKPKLVGRNRLPAQGSSSMQAKRPNSSVNTNKFYSNGQGAADFQNFLHASMAENFVQVKRSRMMVPSNTVHRNKPDFITISDSSDESENETAVELSPDLVSANVDKDMIGVSITSNSSIKPTPNDDSPIPLKKLKQQIIVTQNGLQENGCSPLLAIPKQLPITVPISEHWLYEAITVTMTSVRVGQYHHCGVTQGQFSGKRIAMSLSEVILQIDWFAIVEVEICPEDLHPCMFINLASEFVPNVRSQLGMEPGKIPYFDPGGTDDCKYIIFYLCPKFYKMNWKNLMDKFQVIRKKLKRPTDFVSVMTIQQANERQMSIADAELTPCSPAIKPETHATKQLVLQKLPRLSSGHVLARPPSTCNSPLNGSSPGAAITQIVGLPRLTRSRAPGCTTSPNPSPNNATESIDVHPPFSGPRLQLAIYPPPPAKGGICITNEDQYCLNDGEFLNDVIIDFYLKYIMEQILSAVDRERSHVFSCFFYKRLTQNLSSLHHCEDKSLNPAERRHRRVMKWTRGVDIFSKDYVFIPINESSHWYIAVVCFPGQTGGRLVDAETGLIMSEALARIQATSPTPDDQTTASAPTTPTSGSQSDRPSSEAENTADGKPVSVRLNPRDVNISGASVNSKETGVDSKAKAVSVQRSSPSSQVQMKNLQVKIAKIRVTVPAKSVLLKHSDAALKQVDAPKIVVSVSNTITDQSNAVFKPAPPEKTATNTTPGVNAAKEDGPILDPCPLPGGGAPSSKEEIPTTRRKKQSQYREPCILIFDSLRGPTRSRTSLILREYLNFEWKTRKAAECGSREFDKYTMKMNTPVVPQQDNYSDCGLFLLQYVQQMFQNPITNFVLPIKNLQHWFDPNLCKLKRKEVDSIIKKLHEQQTKQKDETS